MFSLFVLVFTFFSSVATAQYSPEIRAKILMQEYKDVCQLADVVKVIEKIQEISNTRPAWHWSDYFWYLLGQKDSYKITDDTFLPPYGLHKCALNENIDMNQFNLICAFMQRTFKCNIHIAGAYALNHKTRDLVKHADAIKKLMDNTIIDDETILQVGINSCRQGRIETTSYLIERYPKHMLTPEIFQEAVWNLKCSNKHPKEKATSSWNLAKSEKQLEILDQNCKAHQIIHHTALHKQLKKTNPSLPVIAWLLKHDYNPNLLDKNNQTALDVVFCKVNSNDWDRHPVPSHADVETAKLLIKAKGIFAHKERAQNTLMAGFNNSRKDETEKENITKMQALIN